MEHTTKHMNKQQHTVHLSLNTKIQGKDDSDKKLSASIETM